MNVGHPITLVELHTYANDADRIFAPDRHDRLKEILAFNPEHGELIPGTDGVRQFIWKVTDNDETEVQVVYFFKDLDIPLFLVAICEAPFEEIDDEFSAELKLLAKELVDEYERQKEMLIRSRGGKPA